MIKKLIPQAAADAIQEAVYHELYTSHLYKHIANQMQRMGFFGASKFFREESAHELEHYQKLADYLNDVGYVAELPEIEDCDEKIDGLESALTLAYETESDLLNRYAKWYEAVDTVTKQRLLEFIQVQRESCGALGDWLSLIARANGDECALLMIDKQLGE